MCKVLQQAESHFMDFQSLHLAMIEEQLSYFNENFPAKTPLFLFLTQC